MTARPGVKPGVLAPGGRDHGHEVTAMGGDMGQVLVAARLAIGQLEKAVQQRQRANRFGNRLKALRMLR